MAPGAAHGLARPHAQTVAVLGPERKASGGPDLPGHGARVYASKVASRSPGDRPITLGLPLMRTVPPRFSLALLLAVVAAFAAPAAASAADGQIIVKYASGADAQDRADARDDAGVVARRGAPAAEHRARHAGARARASPTPSPTSSAPGTSPTPSPTTRGSAFDLYPDEARVDANGAPLNDQPFANLWALHNTGQAIQRRPGLAGADIGAPAAWGVTTGSSTVKVAVVDSGVDRTHPDLFANLAAGYDFVDDDSDPTDYDGHGTHVAGIIAARGNNGIGVTGVAWQTSLIPVESLDATGEGTTSDIVAAYGYAVATGRADRQRLVRRRRAPRSRSTTRSRPPRTSSSSPPPATRPRTTTRRRRIRAHTTCRTSSASRRPTTTTSSRASPTTAGPASTSPRPA